MLQRLGVLCLSIGPQFRRPALRRIMPAMDRNILFKCPRTGTNVQHLLTGASFDALHEHVAVPCPACSSLHFVNASTGKLLNPDDGRSAAAARRPARPQRPT